MFARDSCLVASGDSFREAVSELCDKGGDREIYRY